jgi:hypothetical protein
MLLLLAAAVTYEPPSLTGVAHMQWLERLSSPKVRQMLAWQMAYTCNGLHVQWLTHAMAGAPQQPQGAPQHKQSALTVGQRSVLLVGAGKPQPAVAYIWPLPNGVV